MTSWSAEASSSSKGLATEVNHSIRAEVSITTCKAPRSEVVEVLGRHDVEHREGQCHTRGDALGSGFHLTRGSLFGPR